MRHEVVRWWGRRCFVYSVSMGCASPAAAAASSWASAKAFARLRAERAAWIVVARSRVSLGVLASSRSPYFLSSLCPKETFRSRASRQRCWMNRTLRTVLMRLMIPIALMVLTHRSRLYLTGTLRRFSNSKLVSVARSLPRVLRNAFVHFNFLGFLFILNSLWHLDLQNLNTLQSLRTNSIPRPGWILDEQNQHFSMRMA
mmetsp:Transcript_21610/g.47505  ORF Transcript_21610/g.47505 Transcript_21610/m.47505 type:complete len:200 (-) Transcript_21610:56-655(-)